MQLKSANISQLSSSPKPNLQRGESLHPLILSCGNSREFQLNLDHVEVLDLLRTSYVILSLRHIRNHIKAMINS